MSDISVRGATTLAPPEDQRWIGGGGIRDMLDARTVTLSRAAFDFAVAWPNRYLPSGIVLGKITASGLYGPYSNAAANGLEVAAGFLMTTQPIDVASTGNLVVPLYWKGEVVSSFLPVGAGLDAAAIVDLAAKFAII